MEPYQFLIYLAGFFDGEGSVAVYRRNAGDKKGYCLRVQLTQNVTKDSTILFNKIREYFDVSLNIQDTLSGNKKYNAALSGDKAANFLQQIKSHLFLKKEQVKVALDWHLSKPKRERDPKGRIKPFEKEYFDRSEDIVNKLKSLKR